MDESNPTSIADLYQDPANARRHTPRNVGMIEQALSEVGAARSIVVDETGTVLAGNATVEAAAQAGITRVQVVDADGETIVAVRRTGLTPEQKLRLALYDNRSAELAEWDDEMIAAIQAANPTHLTGLFTDEELDLITPTPRNVEFKAYDESVADEVEYHECPNCGHQFPK